MKALITGARGQLGAALCASAPPGTSVTALARDALDITDRKAVLEAIARLAPDLIINAAAYTAVDRAEQEAELAHRVNRDAAGHLAEAAQARGARLITLSTDYVFDGMKHSPYQPGDATNPLNVYGASKLAGERVVAERTEGRALIVRTAWVYAREGKNFVNTMLRLLREKPEVRVVDDQVGTPTCAGGLAAALWRFAATPARGIYHWTDAGVTSWYDVAVEIRRALAAATPAAPLAQVRPIPSSAYPTPTRRPLYGVLDKRASWELIGPGEHWTGPLWLTVRGR
jgi:dTDP-4-dehydrorhamnose reductase